MRKQSQVIQKISIILLISTKNGLWIKEELNGMKRIISAERPEGYNLIDLKIFHFDENSSLLERIYADKANIESNT